MWLSKLLGRSSFHPLAPPSKKRFQSMSDICQVLMYIQGHLASWIERCIGQKKSQEPYHEGGCFEMFPGSWQYDFYRNVANSVSPQMPHCHCPPWSFSTFILLFCLLTVNPNQRRQELRWQIFALSPFCITASSLDLAKACPTTWLLANRQG